LITNWAAFKGGIVITFLGFQSFASGGIHY
jgi:hypothetical protein